MRDCLIWWTTEEDCVAIGERLPGRPPVYLRDEYESRLGRNGRGRLWVNRRLSEADDYAVDPWPDTPLGRALGKSSAGIVIRKADVKLMAQR